MKYSLLLLTTASLVLFSCTSNKVSEPAQLPLEKLKLPDGFNIDIYASGVTNARAMALGDDGTLYVGTRREGKVYAVRDTNSDYRADQIMVVDEGLSMPTGLAYKDGDLYVGDVSTIYKYDNVDADPEHTEREVVVDDYPTDRHHGWKYLGFGPDGKLYVPVGAPCNICNMENENPIYASLSRLDVETGEREIIAHGIRNTVGFSWHPQTNQLWFTDNGRDWLGDNIPPCELNVISETGQHFGYPFMHGENIKDPDFGDENPGKPLIKPAQELGPHTAPLGMRFYSGESFPEQFRTNVAFIAEHGSWNRSKKIGYRVMMVRVDGTRGTSYEPFISGWLDEDTDEVWGRPVDLIELPDGSMLVSDDFAGVIYRVTYQGV